MKLQNEGNFKYNARVGHFTSYCYPILNNSVTSILNWNLWLPHVTIHHMLQVLKERQGEIVVARRPKSESSQKAEDYLPCEHCLGFFFYKTLWQHVEKCPLRPSTAPKGNSVRCGKILLSRFIPTPDERTETESNVNELFRNMKETSMNPGIRNICRDDILIREFAMALLEKLGTTEEQRRKDKDNIRTKVRTLGRLLKHLNEKRQKTKEDILTLSDYITGPHFKEVVSGVKSLAIKTNSPSIATNLGHYIKHAALLKSSLAIETGNKEWRTEKDDFMELYNAHWASRVSCVAMRRIRLRAMKKERVLPTAQDLNVLTSHLAKEARRLCSYLKQQTSKNRDDMTEKGPKQTAKLKHVWDQLAQVILAWLCMFNKRRISEIDEIEVADIMKTSTNDDTDMDQYLNYTERLLKNRYEFLF